MIRSLRVKKLRRPLAAVAGAAVLMMTWPVMVWGQTKTDEQPRPADSAKNVHPGDPAAKADDALAEQVQQLREKVAKLEAALSQGQETGQSSPKNPGQGTGKAAATRDTGAGQTGRVSPKFQNCLQCHQTRPSGPLPASHLEKAGGGDTGAAKGDAPAGQGGPTPDTGEGKMSKGMGKMGMGKSMGGEMGGMGKSMGGEMGGMGKSMGGEMGGMGMGAMGKAKHMSMGDMSTASSLPGFPGVSHLYHIGADGFFLDHDEHISLSANQRKKLNQIKQKALLGGSSCGRKVEEAEQQLWELTASDEPDASAIEAKVREIAKHQGDQRLAFIRAVGEAAKVLTDDQRQALAGTAAETDSKPATAKP